MGIRKDIKREVKKRLREGQAKADVYKGLRARYPAFNIKKLEDIIRYCVSPEIKNTYRIYNWVLLLLLLATSAVNVWYGLAVAPDLNWLGALTVKVVIPAVYLLFVVAVYHYSAYFYKFIVLFVLLSFLEDVRHTSSYIHWQTLLHLAFSLAIVFLSLFLYVRMFQAFDRESSE